VPREHLGQKYRKRPPATTALPAIRTKHPLPALGLPARIGRVIAIKLAVTI